MSLVVEAIVMYLVPDPKKKKELRTFPICTKNLVHMSNRICNIYIYICVCVYARARVHARIVSRGTITSDNFQSFFNLLFL